MIVDGVYWQTRAHKTQNFSEKMDSLNSVKS